MSDHWVDIILIIIVVVALLLAFLRRRGVELPWWIDWLGASADVVIALAAGTKLGQWLTSIHADVVDAGDVDPSQGDDTQAADQADDQLPLPPTEPPTHRVDDIDEELQHELEATDDQTAAELEADLKELARD